MGAGNGSTGQLDRVVGVSAIPEPPPPPDERPTRPLAVRLPPPTGIPWNTARRWAIIGGVVAGVCLLLAGIGIAIAVGGDGRGHAISAPLDGRSAAELHLVSGTGVVTVRGADLGDRLYRVSTPEDGDAVPEIVDRGGRLELHLVPTGQPGPSAVEIALSSRVRWQLRLSGGAVEQLVDMAAGSLAGVDFVAGATRIELHLPPPQGTTTVRLGAGAGEFVVYAPAGVPVQTRLNNGAGRVEIDGTSHAGIAPGTVLGSPDWDQTQDRYAIDSAGVGTLTVTRPNGG